MAKKIIQDIFVVKKDIKSIKRDDIKKNPIPNENVLNFDRNETDNISESHPVNDKIFNNDLNFSEEKHVTKNSMIFLWIICIVFLSVLLFILSSTFSTATLTITPKYQPVVLNDTFNISLDSSASGLHFKVMTLTQDLSKTLETDGDQYVERKATGKAVIYNNFSSSKQRLINNTRLETKDGLIYRIRQSVEVPGVKTIAGVKTPGSVEVDIIADMPGDKYNMKLSDLKGDFSIPGFVGDPKYTAFYARLSSDLVGGFVGNVKKVADDKLASSRTDVQNTLKTNLIKNVYDKITSQYIVFKDNYYTQCTDLPDNISSGGYIISEECTINAVMFNNVELTSFIANSKISGFDNSKVDIIWGNNISVSLQGLTAKPWNENILKATFSGSAKIVWSLDKTSILNSIIGQNKSIINSIIENNKNSLTEIQASIRPIWKNTFPNNPNKIKITDTIRDSTNE